MGSSLAASAVLLVLLKYFPTVYSLLNVQNNSKQASLKIKDFWESTYNKWAHFTNYIKFIVID